MAKDIPNVPDQVEGGSHDSTAQRCFDSVEEAKKNYQILRERFVAIHEWQDYVSDLSASFKHLNHALKEVHRKPVVGDFMMIDLPVIGGVGENKFEWVTITRVDEHPYHNDERLLFTCVPCSNPNSQSEQIAHFYSDKASSNFIISRKANCITAEIHGRNEVTNQEVDNFSDKIRNSIISLGGTMGLSKLQWVSLAKGMLNFNK